ncbi:MAG: ATP-binding protein [Bdellovibrionales bacterium]
MKEITILSGKGGTGKTSLTACLALLAERPVIADCDVDAADLHLILSPEVKEMHDFVSGSEAKINSALCDNCGACVKLCRFGAITKKDEVCVVDPLSCEGCGVCYAFCPQKAVEFTPRTCGQWMVSATRGGPMVHARLGIAAENSGRLVTLVRQEATKIAKEKGHDLILVDGPPGIGCPVIASLSNTDLALIITEPTLSGLHDLKRLLDLTSHFDTPTALCVNKWDIAPEITATIEETARQAGSTILGRIRYDSSVTKAQNQAKAVIETDSPCNEDIRNIWNNLQKEYLS